LFGVVLVRGMFTVCSRGCFGGARVGGASARTRRPPREPPASPSRPPPTLGHGLDELGPPSSTGRALMIFLVGRSILRWPRYLLGRGLDLSFVICDFGVWSRGGFRQGHQLRGRLRTRFIQGRLFQAGSLLGGAVPQARAPQRWRFGGSAPPHARPAKACDAPATPPAAAPVKPLDKAAPNPGHEPPSAKTVQASKSIGARGGPPGPTCWRRRPGPRGRPW
jgi:hypothetical protein